MSPVQSTLQTLYGIFQQYLHQAPLFLGLHVCVLVYFGFRAWPIWKETRACRAWKPGDDHSSDSSDTSSELLHQLELFRKESQRWARRGLLMPMTDISDRLDSIIEGWADRLHSVANLFMIVGIAGTFFSMVVLGNTNVENVQAVFKQALGNALPVGFVGILLTLIFYPVSGWLQSGLERAAAEATRKAIEYRGNRDFASAEILLNAFQAVAQLPPKLNSALEPLANLQKTLDTVLGRVLQGLDTKWTESSAKLEKHVEAVAVSIAALRLSVGTVGESLQGMSATLQETAQGAKELQALARESAKQVTQITQSTKELHQGVVESSEALGHAAAKLTEFPETARLELAQAFKDVASKSAPVWKELSDSFIGTLSNATAQEIQGIRSGAEAASKKLEDAATKLHEVAANLSDSVVRVIREAIEALKEPLQNFDATYRRDYPKLLKELKDTLSDTAKQSDRVESLIAASNLAGGNVDQLEKSWNRLSDKASNAADTLGRVARDLESALDRLNEVQGHWLALRLYPSQYKLAAGGK